MTCICGDGFGLNLSCPIHGLHGPSNKQLGEYVRRWIGDNEGKLEIYIANELYKLTGIRDMRWARELAVSAVTALKDATVEY